MTHLVIELPRDRLQLGTLWLEDDRHRIVAGPFPALGKADGITATRYSNRFRTSVRLYGDTPVGEYRVIAIRRTGPGTLYANQSAYGPNSTIVLEPLSGDAAVAQAFGRTEFLIQGGDLGVNGGLRPTNGSIRLSNTSMAVLLRAVQSITGQLTCVCVEVDSVNQTSHRRDEFFLCLWLKRCLEIFRSNHAANLVAPDNGYDEGDPPPRSRNTIARTSRSGSEITRTSESESEVRSSNSDFTPSPSPSNSTEVSFSINPCEQTLEIGVSDDDGGQILEVDIPLPSEECSLEEVFSEPSMSNEATNDWTLECETEEPSLY